MNSMSSSIKKIYKQNDVKGYFKGVFFVVEF